MALSGVKCKVSSCKHWKSGEQCDASAIEVNVDGGGSNARQSEQTNCRTFQMKN
ncbi:DUF1540 domain-containing protein [Sporomusa sphaeroides]|uniref:DUF1540 domain-containing protein n=2 Tax=Sporomusa TaxID=2375 RepID=A0ABM9VZB3_9FIRM|nr:DUF1540 domain-containing protein [Sporomusa sphaeroides]MCM0760639.1 DUF1540 domain-containing protein [Sporomusa sphaeroides DSM 2875]OLS57041.1 hypothetical protein SPSPH_05430 [Sporomusa sphaeroides DSM 2875]CVK18227.1 hypothetical protein SSPH_00864 [Sporomusa sphaeroides DSM 2875]SCM81670.1 conserved hypothetical protein [uncultured Sporomusa sp.]